MAVSSDTTHRRFAASKQCIMAGNQTGKEHLPWMRGKATWPGGGRDHKEVDIASARKGRKRQDAR